MATGAQGKPEQLARAVAAEIRALQGRHQITNSQLAEKSGISGNYLGKRLRNEMPFNLNDLDRIAPVFGLRADQIITAAVTHAENNVPA